MEYRPGKEINATLIIDGAYLTISSKVHAREIFPLFSSKEGVRRFRNSLSKSLVKKMHTTAKDKLSRTIIEKLALGADRINFKSSHILYAVSGAYSPEMIVKEAWEGFSVTDNVHKYKSHGIMCKKCGEKSLVKVQAGVDVGIATRLAEVLLENLAAKESEKTDAVILIAGDRDFKDILKLCMKYQANVFLVGLRENTDKSILKICVDFFDLRELIEPSPRIHMHPQRPRGVLVEVRGISKEYKEEEFLMLLADSGVIPQKHWWRADRKNPMLAYVLLSFRTEKEGNDAIDLLKLLDLQAKLMRERQNEQPKHLYAGGEGKEFWEKGIGKPSSERAPSKTIPPGETLIIDSVYVGPHIRPPLHYPQSKDPFEEIKAHPTLPNLKQECSICGKPIDSVELNEKFVLECEHLAHPSCVLLYFTIFFTAIVTISVGNVTRILEITSKTRLLHSFTDNRNNYLLQSIMHW